MKIRDLLFPIIVVSFFLQPAAALSSDAGLIGYWSFDDGTAIDNSGHGNAGVLHGCTPTPGVRGGALSFNGTSDFIDFGDPLDLSPSDAITIAVWYRPTSFTGTGNDPIMDKGYTSHTDPFYQYHLGVTGDTYSHDAASFTFQIAIGGQLRSVATPPQFWTPGLWYHIAATYNGSMMKLYVNGSLTSSLAVTGVMTNYGQKALSGRYTNASSYLPGTIDELRMYSRAISAEEVIGLLIHPTVPGFTVQTYACVLDPERPTFAPSGDLYVGRDLSGSGGGNADPTPIHRIRRTDLVVEDYGPPISDPDAVLFDSSGLFGPPGSVLVAGIDGPGFGAVRAVRPDQTAQVVFGPSPDFRNVNALGFDGNGRLLLLDEPSRSVLTSTGASPLPLFTLQSGFAEFIAVDNQNQIYTTALAADLVHSTVSLHDSAGNIVNPAVVAGVGRYPLVLGPGGADWGTDLYTINGDGALLRVAPNGETTQVGTGFTLLSELGFGPDGALYVSAFEKDRIFRIARRPFAGATPILTLGRSGTDALLTWTTSAWATGFDVARGDLGLLRSGNFATSTLECLANDQATPSLLFSGVPSPGSGFWFLVRGRNCGGGGTFDTGAASQVGVRDPGIAASGNDCP